MKYIKKDYSTQELTYWMNNPVTKGEFYLKGIKCQDKNQENYTQ